MENRKHEILNGNLLKVLGLLSVPIIISNLSGTLYNLTDSYFVGKIGTLELGAITLVWPLVILSIALSLGIEIGGIAFISQYIGANREKEANKISTEIFVFSLIISFLVVILNYTLAPMIIGFMSSNEDLVKISIKYYNIIILCYPAKFIFFTAVTIRNAQGDTKAPMFIIGLTVILNIILDPIFIFTLNLGIEGAAYATVLAHYLLIPFALKVIFNKRRSVHVILKRYKPDFKMIKRIAKVCFPASIGMVVFSVGFLTVNTLAAGYGHESLAAIGIVFRINLLLFMPVEGISSALSTVVGQNVGAGNIKRVKSSIKTSLQVSIIIMLLVGTLIFIISGQVVGLFTESLRVIEESSKFLKYMIASMPIFVMYQIYCGAFRGGGHVKAAMYLDIMRVWLYRIPLILLGQLFLPDLGIKIIWYAVLTGNLLAVVSSLIVNRRIKWSATLVREST